MSSAHREDVTSRHPVTPSTVVGRLHVSEDSMTRIDVVDSSLAHDTVADEEMEKALPNTRRALLKYGGDYPFLGRTHLSTGWFSTTRDSGILPFPGNGANSFRNAFW